MLQDYKILSKQQTLDMKSNKNKYRRYGDANIL